MPETSDRPSAPIPVHTYASVQRADAATIASAAKHLKALRKRLGGKVQFQWGIEASVVLNADGPFRQLEPRGLLAATDVDLHFFRRGRLTGTHRTVPLNQLRSIGTAHVRISDDQVLNLPLLHVTAPTGPWAVIGTPEALEFMLSCLVELSEAAVRR